jgi:signal peptidase II
MRFYILALAVALIDQFLKYLVHRLMYVGQSVPLLGVLKLTYVQNTGAAFSLFTGFLQYLIAIGVVVVLMVIYFHHKLPTRSYYIQTALIFILGGSLGNLADRISRAYVIDYIDLGFWPVFNFADIMINLGVLIIIFDLFRGKKKDVSGSV